MAKQPPEVNGVMELTDQEKADITSKLQAIQTAFIETDEQPVCDVFYIVATYNKQNVGNEINGDTAEFMLGQAQQTPTQEG